MTRPDKYVVFKREEFEAWYYDIVEMRSQPPDEVPDHTVIRAQDIFAAPALHAYANSITVAMTIFDALPRLGEENKKRLRDLADFFHERAAEAEQTDYRKIPD